MNVSYLKVWLKNPQERQPGLIRLETGARITDRISYGLELEI